MEKSIKKYQMKKKIRRTSLRLKKKHISNNTLPIVFGF